MTLRWDQVRGAARRRELWLRLTRVCDERCLFCYDEMHLNGSLVPFGFLHRQLREARAKGLEGVNLTGGEPTMHPHFAQAVRLAKLLGFGRVHVTTNGRRFKDAAFTRAAREAGLDSATFSVHGHTAELNDKLTRAHGSFRDSIAGLRLALDSGLVVNVHVVVNRLNAPFAGEILRFFRGMGVHDVNFIALVPVSAAWEHRSELYPTPEDGWRQLWQLFERSGDPELRVLAPALLARHAEYVASTARVPGYAGMLERFLRNGQPQPCRGERCPSCPLDAFCRDLEALRENGSLEGRPSAPPCGPESGGSAATLHLASATLASFTEFHLEHRLRVRGSACEGCREGVRCAGAPVRAVLSTGFPAPPAHWGAAS